jgi:hypothetical protein
VQQAGDVNAVGRLVLVWLDVVGAAAEQGDRACDVASGGVCGADGELGEALPQVTRRFRRCLPRVFQHFVGMERHTGVE